MNILAKRLSITVAALLTVTSTPLVAQVPGDVDALPAAAAIDPDDARSVRGAIYIPAYAWNAFQMWDQYNKNVVEHDLALAKAARLNILRVWVSYESWKRDGDAFGRNFDHLAATARRNGLSLLVSMFENDGLIAKPQAGETADQAFLRTANQTGIVDDDGNGQFDGGYCIASPGLLAFYDPDQPTETQKQNASYWNSRTADSPGSFVRWFMNRYGTNDVVYAVESMNEPGVGKHPTHRFAVTMFNALRDARDAINAGSGPKSNTRLTIGTLNVASLRSMMNGSSTGPGVRRPEVDVVTIHNNFPTGAAQITNEVDRANDFVSTEKVVSPLTGAKAQVWLTEWQRTRPAKGPYSDNQQRPAYRTLADTVYAANAGSFFWSLMVKAAYLPGIRDSAGVINGLFWPKISETNGVPVVQSVDDLKAIAEYGSVPFTFQAFQVDGDFSESAAAHDYAAPKGG